MSTKKWVMKQYWRIGTVRALLSLVMSMLVLGRFYYEDIPFLKPLGFLGAIILGVLLVLVFMGIGWVYDIKAKMWASDNQANTERNPYQYVASYKEFAFNYPIFYGLIATIRQIINKLGIESPALLDTTEYLDAYFKFNAEKEGIQGAKDVASDLYEKNPFSNQDRVEDSKISIGARMKLGFQVEKVRLNWIQSLTGLVQDTLVFGVLYIALFIPGYDVGDAVPFNYMVLGILIISLPLFIVLTSLGWYYDRKLQIWSPDRTVRVERNPYNYVPEPRFFAIDFPLLYPMLKMVRDLIIHENLDIPELNQLISYFSDYAALSVLNDEDMAEARRLRKSYGKLFLENKNEGELK